MSYASDCELLGLDPSVDLHDPAVIKDAFKQRALVLHPDIEGGDAELFEAARDAYQRLHTEAKVRWTACPRCEGAGVVHVRSGFQLMMGTCEQCGGTGERSPIA